MDLRVCVVARLAVGAVQVAEAVVALQDAGELPVHGEVKVSVGQAR